MFARAYGWKPAEQAPEVVEAPEGPGILDLSKIAPVRPGEDTLAASRAILQAMESMKLDGQQS